MALAGRPDPLAQLASRLGLETSYASWRGDPVVADRDTLIGALVALGHPVRTPDEATAALHQIEHAFWADRAPPVVVAWDGGEADVALRVPADIDGEWRIEIDLESGGRVERRGTLFHLDASDHAYPGGHVHCLRHARVPVGELGYRRLRWQVATASGEALVIAAPSKAWGAPGTLGQRWGVFAPVYALRGARSGATGDLATLAALRAEVARR